MGSSMQNIRPGDIGFDRGGGIVGWIIRHGTGSTYAHCFVYVGKYDDGSWMTVEAYPSVWPSKDGVQVRSRTQPANKLVRVGENTEEVSAIVLRSLEMVGTKYGWGEIARIALRMVGIRFKAWDSPKRAICSNHCAQAALAGRPEVVHYLRYKPFEIWPGELAASLDAYIWNRDNDNV